MRIATWYGVCLAGVVGFSPLSRAADVMVVGKGADGKFPFSVASLQMDHTPEARQMVQLLRRDLVRSGWFVEVEAGAVILLSGSARGGERVELAVEAKHAVTGRSYPGQAFAGNSGDMVRVAHRTADGLVEAITGHPGIASTRLVFIGAQGAAKDIYIAHPDGSDMMQITRDAKPCLSPAWAPGSEAIIYTSLMSGYADVYRVDLRAARRTVLVNYPGMNVGAVYSPDGQSLALTLSKDGNPELYVKDLRSGALTRLTTTRLAAEASPSWSPDGRRLVYVSDKSGNPQLYTVNREGGASSVLTLRSGESVSPDWGPAGIVYSTRAEGRDVICVIDPQTRREIWRYGEPGVDFENPCWAPDGRHIACVRTVRYRSELYILDIGGDAPVRLTDMQGDWYSPAWSSK